MKRYNIKVNGSMYEVEVEEITATVAENRGPTNVHEAVRTVLGPAPSAPAPKTGGNETVISAPMPGTVLDVRVTAGQSVSAGDVLVILEAMKMENEILAPESGVVSTVSATKGSAVNAGDVLVTLA